MVLNVLLSLLFDGATSPITISLQILMMIGLAKMLKKCGEKTWKAFIPCYRFYAIGKCANRSFEGSILCSINAALTIEQTVMLFVGENFRYNFLLAILVLTGYFASYVYIARVFSGVCHLFEVKRWWVLLWLFVGLDCIPALIWGFKKKYQPKWTIDDLKTEVNEYFSNARVEVMSEGLTVNLEERTATEMGKKKVLLRDVHMNIAPGRMVLLLGGSGAGKTTLLNAINGYEKAKADVHLNGANVYTQYKAMQYEIGFVPQLDLMRGKDTVASTLYDAADLRLPREFTIAERHKRVEEVMEIFGLTRTKNTMVDKLSGGQRKRLSIAMEFISNPSLFILDEPDSGLDGVMARELMEQLRRIANQGKIVIVITHTPDRVIDLFDDVIVLAKDSAGTGRLAYYGPISDAKTFFDRPSMEKIVLSINRKEEGGEGRADEFVMKYGEVQHG